jgi:2',3'-cyclic-nucleotide 2'-phosphodiesterase (5'-nucleotidase family)
VSPSRNRYRALLQAGNLTVLVTGAVLLSSVLWLASDPAGASPAQRPVVTFYVSGGASGYLEDCGCGRKPLGGIPRRAAYIYEARGKQPAAKHMPLEIGNFAAEGDREGRLKTLGAIDAMNRLDYVASGFGERELNRDQTQIREMLREATFPFISANLIKASTGRTWLPPSVVVTVGEIDVGVIAVTRRNPSLVVPFDGDRIVVRDPVQALRRHVRDLERRCGLVMVLAALPVDEARRAAQQIPSIDLIVGAHGSYHTDEPLRVGRTRILYVGEMGTHLGRVRVAPDGSPGRATLQARAAVLGGGVSPDPTMTALMGEVLREARAVRLEQQNARRGEREQRFTGPEACAQCHESIVREWRNTPHASAMETLREGDDHFRSQCVSCHVTGFDRPGGFLDEQITPELANVGCEACHGPGAAHIAQPRRPYGQVTLQTCVTCHTSQMDPDFNYYELKPEVSHLTVGP